MVLNRQRPELDVSKTLGADSLWELISTQTNLLPSKCELVQDHVKNGTKDWWGPVFCSFTYLFKYKKGRYESEYLEKRLGFTQYLFFSCFFIVINDKYINFGDNQMLKIWSGTKKAKENESPVTDIKKECPHWQLQLNI